jgi:hypothetical protein
MGWGKAITPMAAERVGSSVAPASDQCRMPLNSSDLLMKAPYQGLDDQRDQRACAQITLTRRIKGDE